MSTPHPGTKCLGHYWRWVGWRGWESLGSEGVERAVLLECSRCGDRRVLESVIPRRSTVDEVTGENERLRYAEKSPETRQNTSRGWSGLGLLARFFRWVSSCRGTLGQSQGGYPAEKNRETRGEGA